MNKITKDILIIMMAVIIFIYVYHAKKYLYKPISNQETIKATINTEDRTLIEDRAFNLGVNAGTIALLEIITSNRWDSGEINLKDIRKRAIEIREELRNGEVK